jgi:phage terminase large subunit-like protein
LATRARSRAASVRASKRGEKHDGGENFQPPIVVRAQGRYELAAYARHERDLARSLAGDFAGMYFDEAAAEHAVVWIERFCKHHKGEWAGLPLLLEPWQKFGIRCVFGWKLADDSRRFRVSYWEVARKNGKSEVAGAIGAYLMIADREAGGEIYSTATKEDQAKIVWEVAKAILRQSPALRKYITIRQKSLTCERLGSFFKPLGADSDTLDGLNPHGHICDELHAHKKRSLFDVMQTGMGARRQPLTFIITTAGVYDPESIGWEQHIYAQQVLDGVLDDDSFFGIIFAADEGDEWDSETTWQKANPNYGISVKPDYLKRQATTAKNQPSALNSFLRLHLNVWTQQVTRWIDVLKWNACERNDGAKLGDFYGRPAYLGLDLSQKLDITALAVALPRTSLTGDTFGYDFFWRFFVPQGLVDERAREKKTPDYARWVKDGWLIATPGNVIDYGFVLKEILELRTLLNIRQIGFDPWNASQFSLDLQRNGFSVEADATKEQLVEMRQGMQTLSEPSKEIEKLVVDQKLFHDGNPVMRWMVDNAVIRSDANGNIAPDKRSATGKIDGLVASILALGRAIKTPATRDSVYNTRGIRST